MADVAISALPDGGNLAAGDVVPIVDAGVTRKATVAAAAAGTPGIVALGTSSTTACAGDDSRLSDSRAPTGAASGDLGGTYPSPTVTQARGLRETAGPTTLSMGAVADGQLLVRSGSTVAGATAVSDTQHGSRGGGSLHAVAATGSAGFMAANDWDFIYEQRRTAGGIWDFWGASISGTNVLGTPFISSVSGAGAAISMVGEAGRRGIVQLSTGTTTTGRCNLTTPSLTDAFRIGEGVISFGCMVRVPTLADGTEDYILDVGLGNNTAAEAGNGVYFRYARGESVNWIGKTASASARTSVTSSVAVSTSWVRLEFVVNAGGTSVEFFVNGTSIGTSSTNIPTATAPTLLEARIIKSAGTTARTALVDLMRIRETLTSSR